MLANRDYVKCEVWRSQYLLDYLLLKKTGLEDAFKEWKGMSKISQTEAANKLLKLVDNPFASGYSLVINGDD